MSKDFKYKLIIFLLLSLYLGDMALNHYNMSIDTAVLRGKSLLRQEQLKSARNLAEAQSNGYKRQLQEDSTLSTLNLVLVRTRRFINGK